MTNDSNAHEKTSNKPTHYAYVVRERDKGETKSKMWLLIGAAWQHKDGRGFNLELESLPVKGRIVLRDASEKKS